MQSLRKERKKEAEENPTGGSQDCLAVMSQWSSTKTDIQLVRNVLHPLNGAVWRFAKHSYSLSYQQLDEKINNSYENANNK